MWLNMRGSSPKPAACGSGVELKDSAPCGPTTAAGRPVPRAPLEGSLCDPLLDPTFLELPSLPDARGVLGPAPEEVDVVPYLGDHHRRQLRRQGLRHAAGRPRVQLAVREQDPRGQLRDLPAAVALRNQIRVWPQPVLRHATLLRRSGIPRRIPIHVRHTVPAENLEHLAAIEVAPLLTILRGLLVTARAGVEAPARGARGIVENGRGLSEGRELGRPVGRGRGHGAAGLAERIRRHEPAAVQDVRGLVRV
mmetsp:Transcript_126605/g.405324  ORF Transcript_126605/g.405324 Transcript_126605/m.405324 type:complete len:251 (+) Transcript_126605:267-1019(+)